MIHVDRNRVQPPEIWKAKAAKETQRAIESFYTYQPSQSRFEFRPEVWMELKPMLMELFNNKCAYCESEIATTSFGDVEHFRPKTEALDVEEKKVSSRAPGYYWLAYTWENLYIACTICNRNKRNFFPVVGKRAERPQDNLRKERALLLDPCHDRPELYLAFQEDGTVRSLPHWDAAERKRYEDIDRGAITIQRLGLNRERLVVARAREAEIMRNEFELVLLRQQSKLPTDDTLKMLTDVGRPYAGMRRQLVAKLVDELKSRLSPDILEITQKTSEVLDPELDALHQRTDPTTQTTITPQVVASSRTGYIKSIEIKNFKAVKYLKLNFAEPRDQASWKMLLGENASGKSTVLKAVALALMGEEHVRAHGGANNLLNRHAKKGGFVRVQLFTDSEPIEFTFTKKKVSFKSGAEGANLFLRAYGATRLLPREIPPETRPEEEGNGEVKTDEQSKKVDNLFNPYSTLCDAKSWLSKLDEDAFNSAGLTLKDLVHLRVEKPLSRVDGEVALDIGDGPLSLEEQSAGYQAVLALATDIMAGIPGSIHDKQQASGVVLLDEIDAHLHPRWKMEIVKSLREAFKNIQFLATTHEPLCLRGLKENEIAVMKREGSHITVTDNLPSPAGLRVDQLLTSDLFGLYSTIDPDVEARFNEYYGLLARRTLTSEEAARRNELKTELEPYGVLGYTRRDQLIYEVIDEYLAKDLISSNPARRRKLRQETKEKVAKIWRRVNAQRGGNT